MLINATVSPAALAATTQLSSFDYRGETYQMDAAYGVGNYIDGSPFIYAPDGGSFTQLGTASGDLNADGLIGNGAMKNPWMSDGVNNLDQGFDQYLASPAQRPVPFDNTLNVDPNGGLGAASWAAGETSSFVKSYRKLTTTDPNAWDIFEDYHVITVTDTIPFADQYRPGTAGTVKRSWRRSDIDFTPRGIALPVSWPDFATLKSKIPTHIGNFGFSGDAFRRFQLDVNLGTSSTNYSADLTEYYSRWIFALNSSSITESERFEIIDNIMVFGSDMFSWYDAGYTATKTRSASLDGSNASLGGSGQGGRKWLYAMSLPALLKDVSLLSEVDANPEQPIGNGFWISQMDVGRPASGSAGVASQTYFQEQVDNGSIAHIEPDHTCSSWQERYIRNGSSIVAWEHLAILAYNQGPAGRATGKDMILNGADDATNQRAAGYNYLAQWRGSDTEADPTWIDGYDALEAEGVTPTRTFPPQQPPIDNSSFDDVYFSAGASDGEVVLDTLGLTYSTEAITQADFRYSRDNHQWVESNNITLAGNLYTKSGLLNGIPYYCGWRRRSVSGPGPWTTNFPAVTPNTSGIHRGVVTTTGTTASAAPSWAGREQPKIQLNAGLNWDYPLWVEAPATLSLEQVDRPKKTLACGMGDPTGGPVPVEGNMTYLWKADGSSVGITTKEWTFNPRDYQGQAITCDATCNNGTGSASVTTASVTVPTLRGFIVDQLTVGALDKTNPSAVSTHSVAVDDLGPANTDRWIVLLIPGFAQGSAVTSIDLDGTTSFTLLAEAYPGGQDGFAQVWVTNAKVPTGTTGTLNFTMTGNTYEFGVELINLIKTGDATTPLGTGTAVQITDNFPQYADLETAGGGFMVSCAIAEGATGSSRGPIMLPDIFDNALERDVRSNEYVNFGAMHTRAYSPMKYGVERTENDTNWVGVSWS